jgi:hypothetical protein
VSALKQSFNELQEGLAKWNSLPAATELGGTIVAVPSLSLPYFGTPVGEGLVHYEERIFYLAHFLKNPRNKLIIITSNAVAEALVSYLLHLLPGVPHSHARRRLQLLSVQDHSAKPLTQKILDRPALLERLRAMVKGEPRATLSCYTVTDLEEQLAEELQIPLYGPRAEHLKLATKSVARNIFRDLGMTVADGAEHLSSLNDVAGALIALAASRPDLDRAVLKHNYSLAGLGNAIVDLTSLKKRLAEGATASKSFLTEVGRELPGWVRLGDSAREWATYWQRFQEGGGALEAFVEGDACSVQVRVGGSGQVDVIATHDELTGGQDGQTYTACRMPAHPRVTKPLADAGTLIGKRLAELGVVGRFDVDFLASPGGGSAPDTLYALDVNLRKGHTTLPIRTLQLLSSGSYDADEGVFRSGVGSRQQLCYRSSDHFGGGGLAGLLPRDLIEIISSAGLHYSSATQTGALFHMLGSMSERGKVGITSIAHSHDEASETYRTVQRTLERERDGHEWIT